MTLVVEQIANSPAQCFLLINQSSHSIAYRLYCVAMTGTISDAIDGAYHAIQRNPLDSPFVTIRYRGVQKGAAVRIEVDEVVPH